MAVRVSLSLESLCLLFWRPFFCILRQPCPRPPWVYVCCLLHLLVYLASVGVSIGMPQTNRGKEKVLY